MPQTVDRIDFACTDVDPSQWPKLICAGANQLGLEAGSLRLEANRELLFQDNGQLRSFDDNHRLVFNRAGSLLELHEVGDIRFLTGAPIPTEKLRICADGNVGIGIASPSHALEVNGAIKAADFIKGTTALVSSQWTDVTEGINYTSGSVGIGIDSPSQALEVNGAVKAMDFIKGATPLVSSQWSEAAEGINYAGGRVGIGTTSPIGMLDVRGFNRLTDANGEFNSHFPWADNNAYVTGQTIFLRGGAPQGWRTALSVDGASGNVQINGDLNVSGRISGQLIGLDVAPNFTALVRCADFVIGGVPGRGNPRRAIVAWEGVLDINHNGDWPVATIQNFANGSSRERKENIVQLTLAAAQQVLQQLSPVEFSVKTDPEHQIRSGFIAEESPDLVATRDHKAIFVDGIVAVLTKVVQQQGLELSALQAQVTTLAAKVA